MYVCGLFVSKLRLLGNKSKEGICKLKHVAYSSGGSGNNLKKKIPAIAAFWLSSLISSTIYFFSTTNTWDAHIRIHLQCIFIYMLEYVWNEIPNRLTSWKAEAVTARHHIQRFVFGFEMHKRNFKHLCIKTNTVTSE